MGLRNSDSLPVAVLIAVAQKLRDETNGIEPTLDDILEEIARQRTPRTPA